MPLSNIDLKSAVVENPEEVWKTCSRHLPNAWYRRDAQMRRMCLNVPAGFFNGVACCDIEEPSDNAIDEAMTEMQATGMPWVWQIEPGCSPSDLEDRLIKRGLKLSYELPSMAIDLRAWEPAPPPQDLEIRDLNDPANYHVFDKVAVAAFGLPPFVGEAFHTVQDQIGYDEDAQMRNVLGYADGAPVCCGTIFYACGLAGIYTIGTLPEARGKGYGRAITEACMTRARDRGETTAFLQASKMGYPVYEKIGFREITRFKAFILPSEQQDQRPA